MRTGLQLNRDGRVYRPNGGTPVGAIDLGPDAERFWTLLQQESGAWLRSQGVEPLFVNGARLVMSVDAIVAATPYMILGCLRGFTKERVEQYHDWVRQLERL